ncbi:glutamate carboxypeptidase [Isoptericola jiangsuensis]|uniref:Glutamate carboxypeptidase n=1 Tax=Isoptericola jiangsuensis TaxID=548579 RepID=A0A2A9EXB9_9MICO|nr:M20/M25/M40 family metallo-hydrolase [Isoptericola jiangsuensis]PFG43363.1 glutamate carboxypeptidase [Isoptericola jiangsuensis]
MTAGASTADALDLPPGDDDLSARLLPAARAAHARYVAELVELTSFDSGTWNAAGKRRVVQWCSARLHEIGAQVDVVDVDADTDGPPVGPALVARLAVPGTARVLLLGHSDTVFADGTAARRPPRQVDGRLTGPGVCDDKGGVLAGIHALTLLAELPGPRTGEAVLLLSPDEEVGSPRTLALLQTHAERADVILGLEGSRENGDLVVARKGACDVRIELRGRAAHAGIEPERGADAALAAARLVLDLHRAAADRPGVSVNVGVVRAGDRPNVVADEAELQLEVRAPTAAALDEILDTVDGLVTAATQGGITGRSVRTDYCPPFEPSPGSAALLHLAELLGARIGVAVRGASTGGVSDTNFAAVTGIPALDGLGPVGGGDHGEDEWIDLDSVPYRIALLAGLVAEAGRVVHQNTTEKEA